MVVNRRDWLFPGNKSLRVKKQIIQDYKTVLHQLLASCEVDLHSHHEKALLITGFLNLVLGRLKESLLLVCRKDWFPALVSKSRISGMVDNLLANLFDLI